MIKQGVLLQFVEWTASLYHSPSSKVTINKTMGQPFKLERSVHQGCPLALYLFLFVADALAYYLARPEGPKGMPLPGCGSALRDMNEASKEDLLSSAFADDTSLIMEGSPENLSNVEKDLDFFNEAMG
ncbi:uncharacterized protein LOC112346855 [Selaginella moellendorffii]|uniref:uncharacterized protein LOC112346855 n=1 Tax=Selaginella moellendorffii TaxID=88036 RepID=UPI000D1C3CC2|nr:uncharacterized protein LOC112346855 [Selaginella moellendorffii]|eukprot:XP_024532423.1 uncharacterized protein LOC112346855 [Selaginella moellendorffii]